MLGFYRELIRARKELAACGCLGRTSFAVAGYGEVKALFVRYWSDRCDAAALLHFGRRPASIVLPVPEGRWSKRLDSAESRWDGPGSRLPDQFDSGGEVRLDAAGESASLYVCVKGA
jgi:maltooligosyltrehalose trehalohydrolase